MYEFDATLGVKVMKTLYHRQARTLRFGFEITKDVLERKNKTSKELIGQRNILDQAKLAIKNHRKAHSIVQDYINKDGNPKLSGWNVERVFEAVLDDFWKMEQSKNYDESPDEDLDTKSSNSVNGGDPQDERSMA